MSYHFIVFVFCLAVAVSANIQVRKIGSKIYGGRTTDITVVPYQVSLILYGWHFCGGSIIRPSWVLTAAHCIGKGLVKNYTIRAGSSVHWSGGVEVNVSEIIVHPNYNVNVSHNYDVAIVKLEHPLTTGRKIKPIPLTDVEPRQGDHLLISGWGLFKDKSSYSDNLQSAVVPVVPRSKCYDRFSFFRPVSSAMICAGFIKGGKDSCKGDSGGPAMFNKKLVGVVSWGIGCARKNSPGVYTNVAKIKHWVESELRKHNF